MRASDPPGDWLPTRRQLLVATLGTLAAAATPAARASASDAADSLAAIEARVGGRLGVFALDTGSGRSVARRPDERFALCSTFKWVLAAAVLAHAERTGAALEERVPYGAGELLEYAPVTREHVAAGAMSLEALMRAAVASSDNTAANLLLRRIGGPAGFTAYVRSLGDPVTRLDREEPALNANTPGDPRDTTTPRAMAGLAQRVLCGDALEPGARDRLVGWMRESDTGRERLRAGLPPGWDAADKTGTGRRGAVNDVAVAWPPDRPPLVIACYLSDGNSVRASLEAEQAEAARVVVRALAGAAG